jgi:hypothetical protein
MNLSSKTYQSDNMNHTYITICLLMLSLKEALASGDYNKRSKTDVKNCHSMKEQRACEESRVVYTPFSTIYPRCRDCEWVTKKKMLGSGTVSACQRGKEYFCSDDYV